MAIVDPNQPSAVKATTSTKEESFLKKEILLISGLILAGYGFGLWTSCFLPLPKDIFLCSTITFSGLFGFAGGRLGFEKSSTIGAVIAIAGTLIVGIGLAFLPLLNFSLLSSSWTPLVCVLFGGLSSGLSLNIWRLQ